MRVPITRPYFDAEDKAAIAAPLDTGWVVQGPHVAEFERRFGAFTGAPHAIACTSCTTGLHLALAALDIGPGDEVIVPAFTWIATPNVALYCGATPVFADVDLQTFNIDVEHAASKLTAKTRAIIPVHLFGLPADMGGIMKLAQAHDLKVVEDAACGFGASLDGEHVGAIGDAGAFSFHPRKALTTGEGGMVLTKDDALAERLRSLRDHGSRKSDLSRHEGKAAFLLAEFNLLGFNYRMTDIQGALGVTQMKKAEWIQAQRARLAARYDVLLADLDWLQTPKVPAGSVHGYQAYVCLFQPLTPNAQHLDRLYDWRNRLMMHLEEQGVSTRQGTHAAHATGLYRGRGVKPEDCPVSIIAERVSLALPLFPTMSEAEQDYVVEQLIAGFEAVTPPR